MIDSFGAATALILVLTVSGLAHAQSSTRPDDNSKPEGEAEVQWPRASETAEASAAVLPAITVYATRSQRQVLDVPVNITAVTGERIEREMISDIQELVRYEPGVDVNRQTSGTNPFSSFTGFTIRGVGGNRVQLMIDGSRVPERIIDGTRDYFDMDFVKQVDIVRGPGSVLWGSDALGGIVAIETIDPEDLLREGEQIGGQASAAFDSFDNGIDTSLSVATRLSPTVSVMGGISVDRSDEGELSQARADGGIYGCPRNVALGATPCNELDSMDFLAKRGLAKLVFTPNADHRFEVSVDVLDRLTEVDFDQVLGPQYSMISGAPTGEIVHDYNRELDLKRQQFGLEHHWDTDLAWLDSLDWRVAYAPQSYERNGRKLLTDTAGDTVVEKDSLKYGEDFLELDIQATSSFEMPGSEHVLTYGFDGDYTMTDYERTERSFNITQGTMTEERAGGFNFANADTIRADFYIQDEISLFEGRLEVIPGLRLVNYSIDPRADADYQPVPGAEPKKLTETRLTAQLGAIFHIDERFSVYARWAQGFKMPTAQQLYTSLPGAFFNLIPAPNLKPETVNSYEIGLRGQFDRGWFSVNGFYADYDDFIQSFYNPPGTTDYTYRNLSSVKIWGIEASAEARIWQELTGSLALSWQHGEQKVSPGAETTPFDVAPLTATLGLGYEIPEHGLSFDVMGTFAAPVTRSSSPTAFEPDGYAVFDAYASWAITDGVALNAAVLNITNERYFKAPLPGIYETSVSDAVARTNPLELQTAPGRTFRIGVDVLF